VQDLDYTPYTLMFMGACVLMVALGTTLLVSARAARHAQPDARALASETLGPQGGFELIFKDRYLLWIAVLIVLLNVVNTTGGYVLNLLIVSEAAARFGTSAARVHETRQF